jgi:hypothetical protein
MPEVDASHDAQDLVSGCILDVGGVPIRFRASDLSRAEAMAVVIGALPHHHGPACIDISFTDNAPSTPSDPPNETYDRLQLWRGGEALNLSYDGSIAAVATSSALLLGGTEGDLGEAWRYIFHYALPHVLGLHDLFVLHAGALRLGDDAMIVFGESGAGKSTLVLAALDAGWGALSDDLVVVRLAGAEPEAAGIGKPLRVPSDVLADDPRQPRVRARDARQRWIVADHAWDRGWFPIRSSISVAHGYGSGAELEVLPSPETMKLLLGSFLALPEPVLARRALPVLAAIARRGSFQLRHSAQAEARLKEASRMLDQVEGATR